MLGDRIIIEKHHVKKADNIFSNILDNLSLNKKYMVAIAGISGTGKTEVATVIQEKLYNEGIKCYLLSIDDYYKSKWDEREEVRKETGIIGQKEIYWRKVSTALNRFKKGKRDIYVQRLNKFTNQLEHTRINGNLIDCIVCEGLYALYGKFDFGVYLDATQEDTYSFRKKRKKEDTDGEFRQIVLKEEEKCVKESKKKADLIIKFNT